MKREMMKGKSFSQAHKIAAKKDINKTQLKKGIKIELEHTNKKWLAEKIATDHLLENPDYYKLVKLGKGKEYLITK